MGLGESRSPKEEGTSPGACQTVGEMAERADEEGQGRGTEEGPNDEGV